MREGGGEEGKGHGARKNLGQTSERMRSEWTTRIDFHSAFLLPILVLSFFHRSENRKNERIEQGVDRFLSLSLSLLFSRVDD